MALALSVIVCTHNPRQAYLRRVLDALRNQSLSPRDWELIVVDNASTNGVPNPAVVSWHPLGRVVEEPELGLTPARLRGIRESRGDVLVYVDDDNVLDPAYLENAWAIARAWPALGVWGAARVRAEFEQAPAEELVKQMNMLAILDRPVDVWSNNPDDESSYPSGTGLCVRREVAERYREECGDQPLWRLLGRHGRHLLSGDDTLIVQTAPKMGMGWGMFRRLQLVHLIPRSRVDLRYLLELREKMSASQCVVRFLRSPSASKADLGWVGRAKHAYHSVRLICLGRITDLRFHRAHLRGYRLGRKIIDEARAAR